MQAQRNALVALCCTSFLFSLSYFVNLNYAKHCISVRSLLYFFLKSFPPVVLGVCATTDTEGVVI